MTLLLLLGQGVEATPGAYNLTAEYGSYTLTGQDAGLVLARLLTAAQGSYTLTGQDVTLTYTPAGAYTLTAESGSYTLTGQDTGLLLARLLTAAQGTYALTGQAAGLLRGFYVAAAQGTYTLTGQDAALLAALILTASQGGYTLTGQAAGLTYGGAYAPVDTGLRIVPTSLTLGDTRYPLTPYLINEAGVILTMEGGMPLISEGQTARLRMTPPALAARRVR